MQASISKRSAQISGGNDLPNVRAPGIQPIEVSQGSTVGGPEMPQLSKYHRRAMRVGIDRRLIKCTRPRLRTHVLATEQRGR